MGKENVEYDEEAAKQRMSDSKVQPPEVNIPWNVVTISTDGNIKEE